MDIGDWIAEAVPDGLWVIDDDGVTTYGNRCLAQLLGLAEDEVVGFPVSEAFTAEGRALLEARLGVARDEDDRGDDIDCRLVRRDGSAFWARVSHAPLLDDDGVRRGWLLRVRDHSAERRVLEDLRRRELELAEAQSIARLGSWELDVAGDGVLRWSDELYRVLEVDPATFVPSQLSFRHRLHPDDQPAVAASAERMLAGEDLLDIDARVDRPPGQPARWVRIRGRATLGADGAVARLAGTVQDVTEAKEAENANVFLSVMAGAANEASTLLELLLASKELQPYSQWPALLASAPDPGAPETMLHFDAEWVESSPEELAAARAVAERVVVERGIVTGPGPGGTVLIGGAALVDGEVACVIVSDTLDIVSPPNPMYVRVFEQMLTMLARVTEREQNAVELAAARDAALAASRAKSDFLATMSHEIRTPLNGVIGLSGLLGRTELTAHQRRLTEGVDQAGRSLLALVNDILDLSKIEAGRLDLEEVDFDPRQVLEQSVSLLAESASTRGLELVVSGEATLPALVRGDPVRFGQVVTNLVANAVKFTHEGEVEVRATSLGGSDLRVDVRDTGIGIEPGAQDRLFDAFSQADSSTTREYGGTGLGLAISERIVTALGGRIGVVSELGVGSTFWFTARFQAASQPATAALTPMPGLRVLVVDDNETNRFILDELLRGWEVEVRAVDSAPAALAELDESVARGAPYEVVLLDHMMPGTDGAQLARAIRSEPRHEKLQLALLSSGMEPSSAWLKEAGIDSFLAKPVFASRLHDLIVTLSGRAAPATDPVGDLGVAAGSRGRVLVVEDNPVNQLVAEGILRRLGYDLAVAANGAAGVAALAEDPTGFDVVLMDCQMPVMDGFAATRAIRAMEGDVARIPILAMTAAATEDEREQCRRAGMDDFLTKPVVPALLESALARWGGDGSADQRLRTLVEDDGIDPELVQRMVTRFGAASSRALGELDAAVRAGDADQVAQVVHGLRGSAANLGLTRLSELAAEIEERARVRELPHPGTTSGLGAAVIAAVDELGRAARRLRGPS